ncbi:MAG: ECF-type riboflavin transporter substrate-binding protein [Clostridiaceae bacterium]|nr:ECF-type riboflavin transporter substrate-binding protein [Clostridiaceae bacterium]
MKELSLAKKILGDWKNTRTIVTVAIGAALYGVLMIYGGIPIFTNTQLSTALLVPIFVGALTGAVPTAVTLFLGNVIADLIGGWGLWFDWSIGNAVMGFFVGLLPVYGAYIMDGVFKVKHAIIYAVTVAVGVLVAFAAVTPLLTMVMYAGELQTSITQGLVASIANIAILIVLGIPILALMANRFGARMHLEETESDE